MTQEYPNYGNQRPIVEVTILGFLLGISVCRFDMAAAYGCDLFDTAARVASEILRSIILEVPWQSVVVCLVQHSGFLPHLLQIASSIVPALCAIAQ